MGQLGRRVERLEAASGPPCRACAARAVFIMGEMPAPSTCPDCGAAIVPRTFTIDIDRASGREDDAA